MNRFRPQSSVRTGTNSAGIGVLPDESFERSSREQEEGESSHQGTKYAKEVRGADSPLSFG